MLNTYAYARNNPLKYTDPTGLDVTLEGTEKEAYINGLNTRDDKKFTVKNVDNKVTIVDAKGNALGKAALAELGKTLSGGEKELFNAITDDKAHAVIDTGNGQPNDQVLFGRNDAGAISGQRGRNTVDMSEMNLLNSPENKGGISTGDALAHETLEAYANAKGMSPNDAHKYASDNFGALAPPPAEHQFLTPPPDRSGYYRHGTADFPVLMRNQTWARMHATVEFSKPVKPGVTPGPHRFNVTKVKIVPY